MLQPASLTRQDDPILTAPDLAGGESPSAVRQTLPVLPQPGAEPDPLQSELLKRGITKIKPGLYVTQKADNLYFVLEELMEERQLVWENCMTRQQILSLMLMPIHMEENDGVRLTELTSRYSAPELREMVESYTGYIPVLFTETQPKYLASQAIRSVNCDEQVLKWMCYATNRPVSECFSQERQGNIEMSFVVMSHRQAPFQIHMGISRWPEYFLTKAPKHARISVDLHGFAASAIICDAKPENCLMVTSPALSMRKLFERRFRGVDGVQVGHSFKGSLIDVDDFNIRPKRFTLRTRCGKTLFECKSKEDFDRHRWFFDNQQATLSMGMTPFMAAELKVLDQLAMSEPRPR